jgi:membrane protein CcdC involved in cytochrome C biogenesis
MTIRTLPRTRNEPKKRILLIPIILLFGGTIMLFIPGFQFIGTILALTGVMSIFLVGMVFADLWTSHRRTKQDIKAREEQGISTEDDEDLMEDPFEETNGVD